MPYILNADKLETSSNKTQIINNQSTDKEYPSAKAVYNELQGIKNSVSVNISNRVADALELARQMGDFDGVGIENIEVNELGELVINYTDGSSDNLGVILNNGSSSSADAPRVQINDNNEWAISTDGGHNYISTGVKATPVKGVDYFTEEDKKLATIRIPKFEDIDNSKFMPLIFKCIDSWDGAIKKGKFCYQGLGNADRNYGINPLLYSKFQVLAEEDSNGNLYPKVTLTPTGEYRDIYADVLNYSNGIYVKDDNVKYAVDDNGNPVEIDNELYDPTKDARDDEGKLYKPSLQCITLCQMILMGITYECSRLCGHENIIGAAGYGFDLGKLLGEEADRSLSNGKKNIGTGLNNLLSESHTITYNPSDTLGIKAFKHTLAGDLSYVPFDKLGLAKKISPGVGVDGADDSIHYSQIKPGDIFSYGKKTSNENNDHDHSMMCTGVNTRASDGKVVLQAHEIWGSAIQPVYIWAEIDDEGNTVVYRSYKLEGNGNAVTYEDSKGNTKYSSLLWVARPYYQYYGNACDDYKRELTADDDLDKVVETGVYSYRTDSIPDHTPFENAGIVEVVGSNLTDTQKIQRVTRYGESGNSKFRTLVNINGAPQWTPWSTHLIHHASQVDVNLDDITKPGSYSIHNDGMTIGGYTANYWYLTVRGYSNGDRHCTQILEPIRQKGSYTLKRIRRDFTWGPWEWENPPLETGIKGEESAVEYRTTERFQGHTVYAKTIYLPEMPNNSQTTIRYFSNAEELLEVVRYNFDIIGSADGESDGRYHYTMPMIFDEGRVAARAYLSDTTIYIQTFSNGMENYGVQCTVWYTKVVD